MPNQNPADQAEVAGWIIESQRSHYSIGYWVTFVIGMLGETVVPPPRITYTLRNSTSGRRTTLTLAGDHSASDLSAAIAHLPATAA